MKVVALKQLEKIMLMWLLLIPFYGWSVSCFQPNVLFIIIDDLRTALKVYGDQNAHTPNIDKLSRSSYVFRNAFAQQALCAPSRNSMLTSRRPDTLRLYDLEGEYWRDSVGNFTTIPQYFKENGYVTHSVGKVFHPGSTSNFTDDWPYSWSLQPFHPKSEHYKNTPVCMGANGEYGRNLFCPVNVDEQPLNTLPDLEILQESIRFLKKCNQHKMYKLKKFFLAVGFQKPHIPFKYPVEYLRHHINKEILVPTHPWRPPLMPIVAWNPWLDVKSRDDIKRLNISFPFGEMPQATLSEIIRHYNAATTYIDDLIGQLIEHVDLRDTIVLLTSDHDFYIPILGWSLGEHGEFAKYSNFDITTRVPLIVHVPRLNNRGKPMYVEHLVELVDLFPTLVDLVQMGGQLKTCGINELHENLCSEGHSIKNYMVTQPGAETMGYIKSAAFSQYPRPGTYPTINPNSDKPRMNNIKIMGYSMRTNRLRYTEWVHFDTKSNRVNWSNIYAVELYHHAIDPDENLNLANRAGLSNLLIECRIFLRKGWN